MVGMALAGVAQAQEPPEVPGEPATAVTEARDDVPTLGVVRAIKPDDDQPLDLYRFKNPIQPENNRFSRSWSEPPTPEQVSMSGGYVMMGIYYAIGAAAKGVHKLTGGRDQIQHAIARPPPLDEAQMRRAQSWCTAQEDCSALPASGD